MLSTLDLEATPPLDYAHDHFRYRDRLSQPVIEGTGEIPTPGTGAPLKAGEFLLGYADEDGPPARLTCRNPKFFPAMGAIWRIADCKSMLAGFVTSYVSTVKRLRSRNSRQQNSWAAGEVVHRSCRRPKKTIQR